MVRPPIPADPGPLIAWTGGPVKLAVSAPETVLRRHAEERGVRVEVAHDGMEVVLR